VSERKFRTRLELERWTRDHTQQWMSEKTGIPLRTYRRLENGELTNPPIRYLVNCALVLDMPLEDICEPDWLRWSSFLGNAKKPSRGLRIRGNQHANR
jgi:DNA-binding XRE family transcriptional regulator